MQTISRKLVHMGRKRRLGWEKSQSCVNKEQAPKAAFCSPYQEITTPIGTELPKIKEKKLNFRANDVKNGPFERSCAGGAKGGHNKYVYLSQYRRAQTPVYSTEGHIEGHI